MRTLIGCFDTFGDYFEIEGLRQRDDCPYCLVAFGIVRFEDIMLRAFRPSDDDVLSEIHLAKYTLLSERRLATS